VAGRFARHLQADSSSRIGIRFPGSRLFPHMTVRQNLEYGRRRRCAAASVDFDRMVGLLSIGRCLTGVPTRFGRRTSACRHRPRVARRPAAFAPRRAAGIARPCPQERDPALPRTTAPRIEIPVIYVSHSIDEVVRLADHLVLLADGRVARAARSQRRLHGSTCPRRLPRRPGWSLKEQSAPAIVLTGL